MDQVKSIDMATLRECLEEGRPVKLLDVRPTSEREEWLIPGSQHLDIYEGLKANEITSIPENDLFKSVPIVTVCAAGRMSQRAASILGKQGYDVYSLSGGMKSWSLAWNIAQVPSNIPNVTVIQIRRTGKGCLSYMVAVNKEALIIDASVDAEVYADLATSFGWKIKFVMETHLHADHLSRSLELANKVNADLLLPKNPKLKFPYSEVKADSILDFNGVQFKVIPTPGHTLESVSYLLSEQVLFTGDTLFIDGVGRPDLKTNQEEATQRAGLLYKSITNLFSLPDQVLILPGHTSRPVPFDEKAIFTRLGKLKNSLELMKLPVAEFISTILARIPATPPNYLTISEMNTTGAYSQEEIGDVEAGANRCAVS